MTRIVAVRSGFPDNQCVQADFTAKFAELGRLDPPQRALLERLHANSGVDTRHTILPLEKCGSLRGIEAVNDRYIAEATGLGERVLRAALDEAGLAAADLDLLIVTSVTGVAVPSLDARLIPRLGLRPDIKRLPVFGLGCVAGAAALARLHDYLLGWPGHNAALLAIELCSLNWPTAGMTTADLVVSGLFGDGAAALVGTGRSPGGVPAGPPAGFPRILATRSEVYPDSGGALGWQLRSDCFRIVLTAELSDVVERNLGGSVTSFLAGHGLTVEEIGTWICHPGGPRVLDAAQKSLKLPDSAMALSRRSLADVGNLSSVSVLHILERAIATEPPPPGSLGLMIGLGPGVSAELVLMQW